MMTAPNTRPSVSVISVNYKVPELARLMAESVAAAAGKHSHETIIVDNASMDGSVAKLESAGLDVEVVASDENLGFAKGNNLGAARARGSYLAFVNPDVVLGPGSLDTLIDFLVARPNAGLCGPKILLPSGVTQSFPGVLPTSWDAVRALPGYAYWSGARLRPVARIDETVRCGFVHGACFVMTRAAFDAIGGIPAETFMYGEEALLGHRLRRIGLGVWYVPTARVRHAEESSAVRVFDHHEKALRKRWGHVVARKEILESPSYAAWNLVMACRSVVAGVAAGLRSSHARKQHGDFVRLHVRALRKQRNADDRT
jgi:N-acetylglucosaminyl-diphospho-decaprenol L-rhamnosyltransferase